MDDRAADLAKLERTAAALGLPGMGTLSSSPFELFRRGFLCFEERLVRVGPWEMDVGGEKS